MKITKFVHSCLLVEMPAPVNRTALFDPGAMSQVDLNIDKLQFLDDIIITHSHQDHFHLPLIKQLVAKFPKVRVTAPNEVAAALQAQGVTASDQPSDGIVFFDAPHESVAPLFPTPQEIGVYYLDKLTAPGDSHSFSASKAILALPVQAPWGSTIKAVNLALKLKPRHVLPVHDWHWSDEARQGMYELMADAFQKNGIIFHKLTTGEPVVIDV